MDNPILSNARHDREQLVERRDMLADELAQVQTELDKIDAFIEMFDRYAGDQLLRPAQGQPPLANLKTMTIADGCEAIMKAQGGQARMVDMVRTLERAGKLKSSSHRGNYGSVVQTLQRFPRRFSKSEARGLWELTSRSDRGEEPRPLLALRS